MKTGFDLGAIEIAKPVMAVAQAKYETAFQHWMKTLNDP
jgi:hypothetical protein